AGEISLQCLFGACGSRRTAAPVVAAPGAPAVLRPVLAADAAALAAVAARRRRRAVVLALRGRDDQTPPLDTERLQGQRREPVSARGACLVIAAVRVVAAWARRRQDAADPVDAAGGVARSAAVFAGDAALRRAAAAVIAARSGGARWALQAELTPAGDA